jgi:hypothetical protein
MDHDNPVAIKAKKYIERYNSSEKLETAYSALPMDKFLF